MSRAVKHRNNYVVNRGSFDKQRTRCLNKEQIVTRREEAHTGQELYKSKKCEGFHWKRKFNQTWQNTYIPMMKWYMKWIIYELRIWNQVKLWSSQLWTQFLQLRREAWKIQDFDGVWTRDLAIPVRRSNQLSYEATDVGSWSFVGSNGPVRNESMTKWYMKWIIS